MEPPCLTCHEKDRWTVSDLPAYCLQCRLRHCRWFVWHSAKFAEQLLPCSACLQRGPDLAQRLDHPCANRALNFINIDDEVLTLTLEIVHSLAHVEAPP